MNSKNYEEHIYYILDSFTKGGTPLSSFLGGRMEWQTTTLVAGLLSNSNVCQELDAEEILCEAKGDAACRFIMFPASRRYEYMEKLDEYRK